MLLLCLNYLIFSYLSYSFKFIVKIIFTFLKSQNYKLFLEFKQIDENYFLSINHLPPLSGPTRLIYSIS